VKRGTGPTSTGRSDRTPTAATLGYQARCRSRPLATEAQEQSTSPSNCDHVSEREGPTVLAPERADGYHIVAQNEHAVMAGRFADNWGTDRVEAPKPNAAMCAAGYAHDNGWWPWDLYPHLREDGAPVDLFEVPTENWIQFYERGIENAVEMDPYVGLLVSMHGAGIRRQRYGTAPGMTDRQQQYAEFVTREENRQLRLGKELRRSDRYGPYVTDEALDMLDTLHRTGTYDGDNPLWRSYCLLQAWDQLSLRFCLYPALESTTLGPVPATDGDQVDISVTPVDDTTVTLDPYPFSVDPLVVPVRKRVIPAREYATAAELRTAYYEADLQTTDFTLQE
jgi:hypothetical protein